MQSGGFSENSLAEYQNLLSSLTGEEVYDFSRCVRPDGTFYGTKGRCVPPNVPAAYHKEDRPANRQPAVQKDPTLTSGVSAESSKVLSSLVKRRNRQYEFLKDALE